MCFLSNGYSILILSAASSLNRFQPLPLITTVQVFRSCFPMSQWLSWIVNLSASIILNILLSQYIQDGDHSWFQLFTDFWHSNGKLRSREAMVQDSLRELHVQTPSNTPGVLCSHSRLTDLLFISTCLCSFVFLCVVMKTSAEGVQSHSWGRNIRAHQRGHSTQHSVEAYWTEWGPLGWDTAKAERTESRGEKGSPHHPSTIITPCHCFAKLPCQQHQPQISCLCPLNAFCGLFSGSSSVSI